MKLEWIRCSEFCMWVATFDVFTLELIPNGCGGLSVKITKNVYDMEKICYLDIKGRETEDQAKQEGEDQLFLHMKKQKDELENVIEKFKALEDK